MSGTLDGEEGFDVFGLPYRLVKSCPLLVLKAFRLLTTRCWRFGVLSVSSLNSGGSVFPMLDGVMAIKR